MRKQEPQKKAFINRLFNSKLFWLVVVISGALFGSKNKLILNVPRYVDLVEFVLALLIVTPLLYFQVYKKGFYKKDAGGIWFWLMNVFLVLFIAGITTLPFDYALCRNRRITRKRKCRYLAAGKRGNAGMGGRCKSNVVLKLSLCLRLHLFP